MKFKLIRTLSCLVAVACVFLLTIPAMAASDRTIIDYNNYVTNTAVDGANDLVTVQFPTEWTYWGVWIPYPSNSWQVRGYGDTITWSANSARDLVMYPIGDSGSRLLDVSTIPNGSTFSFGVQFSADVAHEAGQWEIQVYYLDKDGSMLSSEIVSMGSYTSDYADVSFAVDKPNNAYGMYFRFYIHNIEPIEYTTLTMHIVHFQLEMSISSLYRLQEQTGKTNELLKDVLNGTPEQNESADNAAGQMGEQADKIDGLIDQATPERPNLDAFDRTEVVPNAGVSVLTSTLSPIINNELVVKIMLMVATLMLVGYVLFGKKGG